MSSRIPTPCPGKGELMFRHHLRTRRFIAMFWTAIFFCAACKVGACWAGFFLFLAGLRLLCQVIIGFARLI